MKKYACGLLALTLAWAGTAGADPVFHTLYDIKTAVDDWQANKIGMSVIDMGVPVGQMGFTIAGIGGVMGPAGFKVVSAETQATITALGIGMVKFAVVVDGVGLVVMLLEPTKAGAATLTNYYATTPDGFKQFLSLPKEQMLLYARADKRLAEAIIAIDSKLGAK